MTKFFDYVDKMGPNEFLGWALVFVLVLFGFDFWRKAHGQ